MRVQFYAQGGTDSEWLRRAFGDLIITNVDAFSFKDSSRVFYTVPVNEVSDRRILCAGLYVDLIRVFRTHPNYRKLPSKEVVYKFEKGSFVRNISNKRCYKVVKVSIEGLQLEWCDGSGRIENYCNPCDYELVL